MNKIYQIKISLKFSKPNIWRRILVPSDMLLSDFHNVIQTTMGWHNSHLHQFVIDNEFYCKQYPEEFIDSNFGVNYEGMKISDFLKQEKDRMMYEYDLGDGWQHDILLEKILDPDPEKIYPVCIKGKMNCPPEDSGGVWGYAEMLDIIKNPGHEEYEDYKEWLEEDFDPEFFDMHRVNTMLRTRGYGCIEIF
jgi:hypothetical protein